MSERKSIKCPNCDATIQLKASEPKPAPAPKSDPAPKPTPAPKGKGMFVWDDDNE